MSVNGATIVSNFDTVLDSGSEYIFGSPSAVQAVYSAIPGAKLWDPQQGAYTFPCDSNPTLAFSWGGGQPWPIFPEK